MKPQNVSACHPRTCLIPLRVTLPFPSPFSQFSLRESLSSSTSFIFAFLHFISTPFIDFAFSAPAFSFHAAEPTSRPFLPYPKLSRVSPILSYPTLSYPLSIQTLFNAHFLPSSWYDTFYLARYIVRLILFFLVHAHAHVYVLH